MDERLQQLEHWLIHDCSLDPDRIEPASGDASFRRYFRVFTNGQSYIAMDAPPSHEDCRPFVQIAQQFAAFGLHVPNIHAQQLAQGFLLLDDLGEQLYLDALNPQTVERLYADALGALAMIQACGPRTGLPDYDQQLLHTEMELFRHWLVEQELQLELSPDEHQQLDQSFAFLAKSALEQPQVCVHRDYHSRNLLVTESPNPGILDFQDAVIGPVCYDLVSLLRDCYIAWPRDQVEEWALGYFDLAVQSGILLEEHQDQFLPWFDLMGIQRHLKASGIFARLHRRDGKSGYLGDIPRTLQYILEVGADYPQLQDLTSLIAKRVMPALPSN